MCFLQYDGTYLILIINYISKYFRVIKMVFATEVFATEVLATEVFALSFCSWAMVAQLQVVLQFEAHDERYSGKFCHCSADCCLLAHIDILLN